MGCGDVRLLRTIGGIDFTGQERAALNKLTMPTGLHDVTPCHRRRPVWSAGVALGVLQSANLWGRPVTLFACTFAPGAQAEGTIGEFFREMARPAGFEPATLGLEGQRSYRGGHSGLGFGNRLSMAVIFCVLRTVHTPPCFLRKKKGSACARPLRR